MPDLFAASRIRIKDGLKPANGGMENYQDRRRTPGLLNR